MTADVSDVLVVVCFFDVTKPASICDSVITRSFEITRIIHFK